MQNNNYITTQTGLFGTEVQYKSVKEEARKAAEKAAAKESSSKREELAAIGMNGPRELGTFETIAKFKTKSITQVDVYRRNGEKKLDNPNAIDNLMQNIEGSAYNGYLSPATKRVLEQMLQVWLTAIEVNVDLKNVPKRVDAKQVYPTFVTLTLPSCQIHSDNSIKSHVLHPFINWLKQSPDEFYKIGPRKGERKGFGVKAFFWRAEPQKSGNIHFHILVDKYIPWDRIREKWNSCCEKLGYVTGYRKSQEYYHRNGFRLEPQQFENDCENFLRIAEKVAETRQMPKKIHPVFREYLTTTAQYGKIPKRNIIEIAAKEKQEKAYEAGVACGWTDPNSTDIHGIQNLDSVAAYVIKYVTKKMEEIKLPANQRIIYSEEFKRDMVQTFDYTTDPLTGEYHEVEVDLQFYRPKFTERKIAGRLWGCSDILRGQKVDKGVVVHEDSNGFRYVYEAKIEENEPEIPYVPLREESTNVELDTEESVKVVKKPFYDMKYFTKVVAEMVVMAPSDRTQPPIYTDRALVDAQVQDYLDILIEKVGANTVAAASLRVGPSFERMRGKIIPLNPEKLGFKPRKGAKRAHVRHSDILKKYAPDLHKDYVDYHNHIFNCLYNAA